MSSLKMTFSLTSLIFLIALGLVFAPTAVMAHDNADGLATTPRPHSHPLKTALPEKTTPTTATDLGTAVPIHDVHPTVSSIVAKPDADDATLQTSTGRTVILLATDGTALPIDGTAAGTFNVRVTFSGTLANNGDTTADANEVLVDGEVSARARRSDGSSIDASGWTTTVTPVTDETNQFDVAIEVPAAAFWDASATPPAHTLPIEVFVDIARGAVQNNTYTNTDGNVVSSVDSDLYQSDATTKFTVVSSLDKTVPTVTMTPETIKLDDMDEADLTITVMDELMLKADSLTLSDFDLVNATAELGTPVKPADDHEDAGKEETYTLTVTVTDPEKDASVTLKMNAIEDNAGNKAPAAAIMREYIAPTPLTVIVVAPDKLVENTIGSDEVKQAVFKLYFSNTLGSGTLDGLDVAKGKDVEYQNVELDDAAKAPVLSDPEAITTGTYAGRQLYELTVTPIDPEDAILVRVRPGVVADVDDNEGPPAASSKDSEDPLDNNERTDFFRPLPDVTLTFGGKTAASIAICEGHTLATASAADENGEVDLPLADGPELDDIVYYINPKLPPAFELVRTDRQRRFIRAATGATGKAAAMESKTYTWTATSPGHDDVSLTFTIYVKEHQLPKKPTGLMATKLDANDTNPTTANRVRLTWDAPMDMSSYPDCIPTPANYVVFVEKYSDLTTGFEKLVEYSSVPDDSTTPSTPSSDEDKFTRNTAKSVTQFTAKFEPGVYRFKIAAHNISDKSSNTDKTKDVGLGPQSDYATWAVLGDEEHVVVADPPTRPADVEIARYQTNNVTVNWLKVSDPFDGGAPVYDDPASMDPVVIAARKKYYGDYAGSFGGYAVYQIDQSNGEITRYPEEGVLSASTVAADARIGPLDEDFYGEHPTVNLLNLKPGEYVIRVTASNIAGESLRSFVDNDEHRVIIERTTVLPTFTPTSINDLSATQRTAFSTTLPEATLNNGTAVTLYYSLTPALPAGLHFNASTRMISGTPTVAMPSTQYIYSASDNPDPDATGAKTGRLTFNITVSAATAEAKFDPASISDIEATQGQAITTVTLPMAQSVGLLSGVSDIFYSLTPALPTGLTFNASTRMISGTPTVAMASTQYVYHASDNPNPNAVGARTHWLTFNIAVQAQVVQPIAPYATYDDATSTTTIHSGTIAANGFYVIDATALPDMELFFSTGGTITLTDTADTAAKTVVMSEILWGLDFGEPALEQSKRQFIELYNTNMTGSIDLAGWTLVFKEGRPTPANDVDQISNVYETGWIVDVGQSGRVSGTTLMGGTVPPTDIISMYRNINFAKVQNTDGGDVAKRFDGFPDGNAKGSWIASTRVTTDAGVKSSPGRQHFQAVKVLTPTDVPSSPFIINEIGNGSGGTNDWIEFRNVTAEKASLKNYQLSVVTGTNADDKKDTQLFHFHDKNYEVPGGGVIVVTSTHPRNTDLAQGKDVNVADDQEENNGASHLFVVRSFNLPDSGKTLLILRNNHETKHLGTTAHIIDVVGTLGIAIKTTDFETKRWPLSLSGAPHGNVIEPGDEELAAGKVYTRANADKGSGSGEKHIGVAGYTGLGYDRAATPNAANGGTPGYGNGAIKGKLAELDDAESTIEVTFSEIMLDVGTGRQNLPQWIEIYNNSMMQAVNTNGWKLHIENHNDVDTALDAVLTLGDMKIGPNQTILIVTNSGRVSDPDHFPSNRIVNLWTTKAHRDALGTTKRTQQVFSQTGLYLKLTDADNKKVDEFGNLDGNRRTREDPHWTIPKAENEEGRRSSLIRIYASDEDASTLAETLADGTEEEAWVLADTTNLAFAISQTYYGDPDDYSTPGFRGGGPLPVSLSKFRPERMKDTGEIIVRWVTESELNNAGFNILRSEKRDGEFTKVHFQAGKGTTSERTAYEWKDTTAKPNVVYYYQIQDVSLDGDVTTLRITHLRGNVTAVGKATTTWGEIKALQ